MLSHLLKYTPALMYKNREGALFNIIFPLAFGLLYLMIFTGLMNNLREFDSVPVAIVWQGNSVEVTNAQNQLASIAQEGQLDADQKLQIAAEDKPLLAYISVADLAAGQALAADNVVEATILVDNHDNAMEMTLDIDPSAINNFSSSVLYAVLSSYTTISTGAKQAFSLASQSNNQLLSLAQVNQRMQEMQTTDSLNYLVAEENTKGTENTSIYFYSALAYLCIFFMTVGTNIISLNEANQSSAAMRVTAAPVSKWKIFVASFISWGLPCLLIVYTILAIYYYNGVPLGNEWGRILLLLSLGLLVGLLLGTAIMALFKRNANAALAFSIGLPLLMGTFSGLVSLEIKVFINEQAPWLNKINPVSLINDGIYYLNNYPTFSQYNQNVLILSVMAVVLLAITIFSLRRSDYASL